MGTANKYTVAERNIAREIYRLRSLLALHKRRINAIEADIEAFQKKLGENMAAGKKTGDVCPTCGRGDAAHEDTSWIISNIMIWIVPMMIYTAIIGGGIDRIVTAMMILCLIHFVCLWLVAFGIIPATRWIVWYSPERRS